MCQNSNKIEVSIKCLVYNQVKYLRKCLDGFVNQKTNFSFEVIVHDDKSNDGSTEIIKEYAAKYPSIIIPIIEEENIYSKKGFAGINEILKPMYKGKYLAFCEGDDYWTDPNKLQKQYDALEQHPECTVCFTKAAVINAEDTKILKHIPNDSSRLNKIFSLRDYCREEFYIGQWTFHTSTMMFRRSILDGYMEVSSNEFKDFPYGDMPMMLYNLIKGNGIYIDEITSHYRWLSGGYNSYMKDHIDKANAKDLKLIDALKAFDKYTNYKYSSLIDYRIKNTEVIVYNRIYGNEHILWKSRYWKILSRRSFKRRLSWLLKELFPCIQSKLKARYGSLTNTI